MITAAADVLSLFNVQLREGGQMDSLLEEDEDEDWGLFDDADAPEE